MSYRNDLESLHPYTASFDETWRNLLQTYRPQLRCFFRDFGLCPAEIEDLVQETCRRAHEALPHVPREGDSFESLLLPIARIAFLHHQRSHGLPQTPASEDHQAFCKAAVQWSQPQRQCLKLLLEGHPPREIARLLKIPRHTVTKYLEAARLSLRPLFAAQDLP